MGRWSLQDRVAASCTKCHQRWTPFGLGIRHRGPPVEGATGTRGFVLIFYYIIYIKYMTYTKGLNKSSYNLPSEVGKRPSWNQKIVLIVGLVYYFFSSRIFPFKSSYLIFFSSNIPFMLVMLVDSELSVLWIFQTLPRETKWSSVCGTEVYDSISQWFTWF